MARYTDDDTVVTTNRVATGAADTTARMLSWIAIALSVLALVLSWMAYSAVSDVDERIKRGVDSAVQTTKDAAKSTGDAIDAGPDGVDEDDTDVVQPTN